MTQQRSQPQQSRLPERIGSRRKGMAILALCGVLAIGAPACGSDEKASSSETLTASELRTLRSSQESIRAYCRRVGLSLARGEVSQYAALLERALAGADRIGHLARAKPAASVDELSTTRDVLADTAEDLEGTNCSPAIVQRLERALAQVPPAR